MLYTRYQLYHTHTGVGTIHHGQRLPPTNRYDSTFATLAATFCASAATLTAARQEGANLALHWTLVSTTPVPRFQDEIYKDTTTSLRIKLIIRYDHATSLAGFGLRQ